MNSNNCPRQHQAMNRREMLCKSGFGFGAIAAADLLAQDGQLAAATEFNPLAPQTPDFAAKAKRVIFIFLQGGPSHIETFDPKPALQKWDGELLPESFREFDLAQTNTADGRLLGPLFPYHRHGESGLEISTLFPRIGQHADEMAVIRSCYHESFIHGAAVTIMSSGTILLGHPTVGAWVTYGLGSESDRLPAYVAMTDAAFTNGVACISSGFLPAIYQGTHLRTTGAPIMNLTPLKELGQDRQRQLLNQINQWNTRHRDARPHDSRLDARIANYELAFRMQTAAPDLIDLGSESQTTRNLYGLDGEETKQFGGMCLLARRMAERGVRYIHLASSGWDAHGECRKNHLENAKKIDQPIAGLLTDLKQRGLLEETLVVWAGEFGRTPIMQGKRGRDHHPYGFSCWMAGGGIRGGKVIGATDEFGFHAVEDRVHANDLHATMLSLLGLEHEKLTYLFEGRERRLTDVGGSNDLAQRLLS
ncbi:MAG: DUF1501 domain-containing protein [Pirellulaceae bacterium]|nr:DUF1501 domain-containing protein [Pirellulaceae bacterium]